MNYTKDDETRSEKALQGDFDMFFDDVIGPIRIGQLEYSASRVLKEVDPIAYTQEFLNWLDSEGWLEWDQ